MVHALVTGPAIGETISVEKKKEMSAHNIKPFQKALATKVLLRTLGPLLIGVKGELPTHIKGIALDSRAVKKGFLFIAMKGEHTSGERFIEQALKKGATCIMVEKDGDKARQAPSVVVVEDIRKSAGIAASTFYGEPTAQVPVVAVTGTNGKTTFTYLMETILREAGLSPGVIGTVSYRLGEREWPSSLTTPDPVTLQKTMREMVTGGADIILIEASSHALAQKRLWGSRIKCAVFTNMTRDHLDYHKTMDNYFLAKQSLFLDYGPEISAFNIDDPYGHILYLRAKGKKITYSLEHEATINPTELLVDLNGIDMVLDLYGKSINISSRLLGRFNVYNILAAISASLCLGIPSSAIQKGIYECQYIPGRMERICEESPVIAFVDYAHTPDAVERVIREVKGFAPGRVITVIGCGGERDAGKRPLMGYIPTRLSDLTIFTSDNPRSEDPLKIIGDMLEGLRQEDVSIQLPRLSILPQRPYKVIVDREEAIRSAINEAHPGDTVLVLGKGHETYQLIGGKKRYFDDRKIVKDSLKERGLC